MQWKCQASAKPVSAAEYYIYITACILKYFNFNIYKSVKYKVIKSCKNPNVLKNNTETRKLLELKNICTLSGVVGRVWLADRSSGPASNYIPIYWEYFSFYFRTVTTIQLYRVTWKYKVFFFIFKLNTLPLYVLATNLRQKYNI